jgi:hypothetical protein
MDGSDQEQTGALRRVRRLSAALAQATVVIGVLLILGYAWVWNDRALLDEVIRRDVLPANVPYRLDGWIGVGCFLLGLLPLANALFALCTAFQLFRGYRAGEVFTNAAGRRLQRIGIALVLLPAVQILAAALASMLLTLGDPAGQAHLVIRLHEGHLTTGLAGGLVLVVGWAMAEAARIAAENREFV